MIKLNNKNITYVALADSNNSLKAPKEIWYADSSNSVKLVYRRKDALIEGEDYEKYHWILTDTGTPHIQVADGYNTDSDAYIETTYICNYTNVDVDMSIGFGPNSSNNNGIRIFNAGGATFIDFHKRVNGTLTSFRASKTKTDVTSSRYLYASLNSYKIDNGNVQQVTYGTPFDSNVGIPGSLIFTNGRNNDLKISSTKMRVNNVEYYLIPCKLLKPVPKWLDANGIRRQIGECGMIDLVSGKFYGNVNSVGTFTVENYYEKKEWLVGDGSAYIDTDIIVNTSTLGYEFKISIYGQTQNGFICGSRDNVAALGADNTGIIYMHTGYDTPTLRLDVAGRIYPIPTNLSEITIQWANIEGIIILNGVTYTSNKHSSNSSYTFRIFDEYIKLDEDMEDKCFRGKMSYFKLNDSTHSLNLIPCTLTMDLPASMDANNIARTKGTSGMWDLVSDKFYGNVASSGTFKAVNLAEGVDYEVHNRLIMHGTSGGYGAHMKFAESPISLSEKIMRVNIGLNRIFIVCTSPHYYLAVYSYGSSGLFIVRQWAASDPNNVVFFEHTHIDGQELVVNFSTGKMQYGEYEGNIISNETYTVQASQNYYESPHNSKTVRNFKIDGVIDLIPVKLLKAIPSKYDANGIARQAGECGMYDTVNDVFYGNAASSGTFSVSD